MKISVTWLKEFIAVEADGAELAERLSFAGIEVASVEPAVPAFQKVVVGKVESVEAHPSADKLKVCKVDAGTGALLQIVCGAPNVRAGMKAPVILPGGQLLDGTAIKLTQLRGVDSSGMLCSARELQLSEEASGLMALPDDAPVGQDLHEYLGDDEV
ncbi:MAG TPA: phenylalanine--tRNA ligase subunit beta, partial [Gammaproteobacteria bacterium]|nr:phenylalanine--tRNA ligase subunit beta [Gammaproteobacteria bacterium]